MKVALPVVAVLAWMVLAADPTVAQCAGNEYQCQGTDHCIDFSQVCDGHLDCHAHGDDEFNCGTGDCDVGEYQCHHTHHCIDIGQVCDGNLDCHAEGDDEMGCHP